MNTNENRLRESPSERFAGTEHFFDLNAQSAALKNEGSIARSGHRQITLLQQGTVTMVLFAFEAEGELKDHAAKGLVTIQLLEGALEVRTPEKTHALTAGTLVVLNPQVVHSVKAREASRMLLTVHLVGDKGEKKIMPESVEIDVRSIPKPQRHPMIFAEMDKLPVGGSVVVKNDHNPIPLRGQVEQFYAGEFEWSYLEEGPEIFRLCFKRVAESKGKHKNFESTLV